MVPLGPWPKDPKLKEVGNWEYILAPESVEAYGLRLYTQVLGWSSDEAKIHHALVRQQLCDRTVHAYVKLFVLFYPFDIFPSSLTANCIIQVCCLREKA